MKTWFTEIVYISLAILDFKDNQNCLSIIFKLMIFTYLVAPIKWNLSCQQIFLYKIKLHMNQDVADNMLNIQKYQNGVLIKIKH